MQELKNIRNIGIIAHIDAGKTSVTEGMLFFSGKTHRYGNIDDGTTVMDYLDEEKARGITIVAAAASFAWNEHLLHLIDTPGHIDFTAEVERSLRVIDGAVVIFSGVEGVEAQSEKVWRQADKYKVPKIAFVNKLDRVGADFQRVLDEINDTFHGDAIAVQQPVGIEDQFKQVVDLVEFKLLNFISEQKGELEILPVPEELQEEMSGKRDEMIEMLADFSDELATVYLEGEGVSSQLLNKVIRKLTLARTIVPVFCGSAKNSIGIQPLMDATIKFLPSPADCGEIVATKVKDGSRVTVIPDENAPFAGFIFKIVASRTADLVYLRTYTGTLNANSTLVNTRTGEKIRAKQILRLYAKNTESIEQVGPGDIVALIGPRGCGTGDAICSVANKLIFEKISFPEPVISMAVEPKYSKDKDKVDDTLDLLCREDPTLFKQKDDDTGQRILSGMGELHLEVNLKRLANEFKLDVRVGEPRVAYRETLKETSVQHVLFSKVIGDTELYAEAEVAFKPLSRGGEMFEVGSSLRNRNEMPRAYVVAAERALLDGLRTGGSHGYSLIYVSAELISLKVSDKTTEGAVVAAMLQAINQAISGIGSVVLEPLMRLEILAPEDTVGEISMYLQPRRAVIHEMVPVNEVKKISCEVPLVEMFGFGKALPRLSGGRAVFSMEPCGYQALPESIVKKMFESY